MTIQDFLTLLLHRWRLMVLAVLVAALTGLLYQSSQPQVMATEGRLLIGPSLEGDLDIIESTGSLSRGTLQQTLAEIITGNQVTRDARAAVGTTSTDYEVKSVVIPETNVAKVTVSGPDGEEATALASAIMAEAATTFERLYPVYAIGIVDQPDDWRQIAPNTELGLVVGGLIGASLASIGLVASASADRVGRPDRVDEHDADAG